MSAKKAVVESGEGSVAVPAADGRKLQIVVAIGGWVLIGPTARSAEGYQMTDAKVIRVWGTTSGLGQLAISGPIAGKTILDDAGIVELPTHAVIFTIECRGEKWEKHYKS